MPKRYQPGDFGPISEELKGESARSAIAVAGSLLERALEDLIQTRFEEPKNKTEEGILFSEMGVIGSFNEKIWVAYFLGLIGPDTRRDMDLIRSVRNEAAHDMNPISFDTDTIKSRCLELRFAEAKYDSARDRFLVNVHLIIAAIHLKCAEHEMRKAKTKVRPRGYRGMKHFAARLAQ